MREEGLIKGWGIGVNTPEPIMRLLEVADPDVCLLASQYSLIDHKNALDQVFPAARARNVFFVIGSSLNAGFLSGSPRYNSHQALKYRAVASANSPAKTRKNSGASTVGLCRSSPHPKSTATRPA